MQLKLENNITWFINKFCNFQCEYCWLLHYNSPIKDQVDIGRLREGLSCLHDKWDFLITGGEPFLEKNFIEICQEITKNQYLSVNTNLSTSNIFDFADKIDPQKTTLIRVGIHIAQRENRDPQLKSFIEKMLYLQKKGFFVKAVYVSFPTLFDRIKSDIEYLRDNGLQNVVVKIFYGTHNGVYYPDAFSAEQKDFLMSLDCDDEESEIINSTHNYYGLLCSAGQRRFLMDREGNLKRCHSTQRDYGNLFDKTIIFDKKPRPCPKTYCTCPYEGLDNAIQKKAGKIALKKEDYVEKILNSDPGKLPKNNLSLLIKSLFDKEPVSNHQ